MVLGCQIHFGSNAFLVVSANILKPLFFKEALVNTPHFYVY